MSPFRNSFMRKSLIVAMLMFCVLASSAFAYQDFSYNPYLGDGTFHGVVVYTNSTLPYATVTPEPEYNVACTNSNGCLYVSPPEPDYYIFFAMPYADVTTPPYSHIATNGTDYYNAFLGASLAPAPYNDTYFSVPAGEEVVLYVSYRGTFASGAIVPTLALACRYGNGTSLPVSFTNVSVPDAVEDNGYKIMTTFVPPSSSATVCQAYLDFVANSDIQIDTFHAYTYDIQEARDPANLFLNETAERIRYCGAGSSTPFNGVSNDIYAYNSTTGMGYLFAQGMSQDNEGFDGTYCLASIINNTVTVRRVANWSSDFSGNTFSSFNHDTFNVGCSMQWAVLQTRDPYYWLMNFGYTCQAGGGGHCAYGGMSSVAGMVNSLLLDSMQVTTFQQGAQPFGGCVTPTLSLQGNLTYDGIPVNYVNLRFLNRSYNEQTVDMIPYSAYPTPAGNHWNYQGGISNFGGSFDAGTSFEYPFFTTPISYACDAGYVCDNETDYEHYVSGDCSLTAYSYCGDAGCDAVTGRCVSSPCSGSYWACNNAFESWHYNSECSNDLQLLCPSDCDNSTGQCSGEVNCVSDSDCSPYCSGSNLYSGGSCNLTSYDCAYSSQLCANGCSAGACISSSPVQSHLFPNGDTSPLGAISAITGGMLGFLNVTGVPLFNIIFWIFVIMIIISIFSLVAYAIKHGFTV